MDPTNLQLESSPAHISQPAANPKEHEQEAMIVVLSPDLWGGLQSRSVVEIAD